MVKTKRKSILRTLLCAVFALCFAVGLSSLFASGTTAYAAAVTTPKYAIPITYSTWYSSNGGRSTTGSGTSTSFSARIGQFTNSTYSVSFYGSGSSGTCLLYTFGKGRRQRNKNDNLNGTCRRKVYGKFQCKRRLACKRKTV